MRVITTAELSSRSRLSTLNPNHQSPFRLAALPRRGANQYTVFVEHRFKVIQCITAGALIAGLAVTLNWSVLTPTLKEIGNNDEAFYIRQGAMLANGKLPLIEHSPAAALLFSFTYLVFQGAALWFVYSCALGRLLLFSLLWLSSYSLAKRIAANSSQLIHFAMVGLLLVFPVSGDLLRNGSHALFAAFSAFALGYFVSFHLKGRVRDLWIASTFVGFALLARMGEGTVLLLVFIGLSVRLGFIRRRIRPVLTAIVAPLIVTVGGYVSLYYLLAGVPPLGSGDYFYSTFEQGHALAYIEQFQGGNFWVDGQVDARRLFGTPEENQHSVISAILHNPTAYLLRIPRLTEKAILGAIGVYGGPLGLGLFVMVVQGCIELVRQKRVMLLTILLLWMSYGVIYILLVFQPTHLLIPFSIIFCLAAVGLTSLVSQAPAASRYLCSAILVAFVVVGLSYDMTRAPVVATVLLVALWVVWIVSSRYPASRVVYPSGLISLLLLMAFLREGPVSQKTEDSGSNTEERAVVFLSNSFAEETPVAAYHPNIPWAAKKKYVPLYKTEVSESLSDQEFYNWMIEKKLQAIYADADLRQLEPSVNRLIENQIGKSLEVAFSADSAEIQVLRVIKALP